MKLQRFRNSVFGCVWSKTKKIGSGKSQGSQVEDIPKSNIFCAHLLQWWWVASKVKKAQWLSTSPVVKLVFYEVFCSMKLHQDQSYFVALLLPTAQSPQLQGHPNSPELHLANRAQRIECTDTLAAAGVNGSRQEDLCGWWQQQWPGNNKECVYIYLQILLMIGWRRNLGATICRLTLSRVISGWRWDTGVISTIISLRLLGSLDKLTFFFFFFILQYQSIWKITR